MRILSRRANLAKLVSIPARLLKKPKDEVQGEDMTVLKLEDNLNMTLSTEVKPIIVGKNSRHNAGYNRIWA
jgi:hypothetical protein